MPRLAPFVSIVALFSTTASVAAEPAPLAPTGSWVVDFDDAQCVASREYGTEAAPLTLAVKAPPIGEVMQLIVIRPDPSGKDAEHSAATVQIDGNPVIRTSMVAFTVPENRQRLYRINVPADQFASVGGAKSINVVAGADLHHSFALAQMKPLLNVIGDCTEDLRRVWNVAAAETSTALKQRAVADLTGLTAVDSSVVAMDDLKGGTARVAVLIDEAGKVADCVVVETSGVAALDANSCSIMKQRARFQPAVGVDGKPAKDTSLQTVSWEVE